MTIRLPQNDMKRIIQAEDKLRLAVARKIRMSIIRKATGAEMDISLSYPSRLIDYHENLGIKDDIPLGNMSVCRLSEDRLLVSIRQFTYKIDKDNRYIHFPGSFEGIGCNSYLAVVNKRFDFIRNVSCGGLEKMEDIRLLRFGGIIQASGTDFHHKDDYNMACVDFNVKGCDFQLEKSSKTSFAFRRDKNYIPIEDERGIFITDILDGEIMLSSSANPRRKIRKECVGISKYRGNTQLLRYRDGYVALVHRVNHAYRKSYLNAFAFFDRNLQQCRISKEFTAFGNVSSINFSCGMVINGENALIPVCVHDRETHLFEIPLEDFAKTAHWRS